MPGELTLKEVLRLYHTIPFYEVHPMFYVIVAIKLILGLLALVLVINLTGKGNLAPASASDQVQNYVLGGIVGGVIYNTDISMLSTTPIFPSPYLC